MKVMLLAAGLGVRMGALTRDLPKPLIPVAGKPLIVWQLEKLKKYGFTDVVINCAYQRHKMMSFIGNGSRWGVRVSWSQEIFGPLETGGGIVNALPLLGRDPFLLVNSDVWWEMSLPRPPSSLNKAKTLAHLLLVNNPTHHLSGDFRLYGKKVCAKQAATGKLLTYSGIAFLHPNLFAGQKPGARMLLAPLLQQAVYESRVTGSHVSGLWVDVGTPERLAEVETALAKTGKMRKKPAQ